jgi:Peptidase inhibitor I78 family
MALTSTKHLRCQTAATFFRSHPMSRYAVAVATLLLTMLAACTTSEPATPEASASASTPTPPATGAVPATPAMPPPQRGCDPEAARSLVGQVATAEVVEQARSAAGAEIARTLKPGQMVTMEFHPSRLNIDVDAGNAITNVRCG